MNYSLVSAVKEITKHGEKNGIKSVKAKDGDSKLKVKFDKSKGREEAIEKAKKMHSVKH